MSSSKVQSIDLPTDCTAWRFWMMRQPNGCSTPAPKFSAAKQWIKELAQLKEKGLYCVTITWFTSSYDSRRFATCCCLLLNLNADILADSAAGQWLLTAVSHVVLYCVKRRQSESIAMQPQVWNIHCWCSVSRGVVLTIKVWNAPKNLVAILKLLLIYFEVKQEKVVGTPFPRIPAPLPPWVWPVCLSE